MNAAVRLPIDEPLPTDDPSVNTGAPATFAPSLPLDEAVIARAMAEAAGTNRSAVSILTAATGRATADLAQALATALDYRFVSGDEMATLEPAFDVLPPSEATRRCCAVVHTPSGLLAMVADPFDSALRSWLETRTTEVLEWAVAVQHELANFIARRAEALRAIDSVLSQAEAQGSANTGPDNLSYVSISEDSSPIVRLVHSTVYDALRAGASDIHLESTANGLTVRYRIDGVVVNIASVTGMAVAEQVI